MADQFLGEIRPVPFNFAPTGWALCNGQTLPITQYTALFSLLGTTFGGNGTSNFMLPNLQGQVPIAYGQGAGLSERVMGENGGSETLTLLTTEIPQHTHTLNASTSAATTEAPAANVLGTSAREIYSAAAPNSAMSGNAIGVAGAGQPHENRQPYLVINYIIALEGIYPPRD